MPHAGFGARRAFVAWAALTFASLAGCEGGGPKTHPVRGRVELAGGDVKALAGETVEVEAEGSPGVRASGPIGEDGTFELGGVYEGQSRMGAAEGKYRARIILDGVDPPTGKTPLRSRKPLPVNVRYLKFDTSGLTVDVPAAGEVVLKVSRE